MNVRVVYHDNSYDMISAFILQLGIDCRKIKMFYRESEKRWIMVGLDPVRMQGKRDYEGPERRTRSLLSEQHALSLFQRNSLY